MFFVFSEDTIRAKSAIRVLKIRDRHLIILIFNLWRLRSNDIILITLKIVLCHYRNDSKPDIPKQILLISKQKISSGNRIYFFTTKPADGTAVFDDDGKDFRPSIRFSKEMKRQLGLAPGFPLELTHNPNPKLEIPAVPFNSEAANRCTKKKLLFNKKYISPRAKNSKIKFRDIFTDTVINSQKFA